MKEEKDSYQSGKNYALGRLNRRECSSSDIRKRLILRGIPSDVASQIVSDLAQASLLDDERFSRLLIRQQIRLGKGPRAILQKLKQNGISYASEQIKTLSLEMSEPSEQETARALVERKYPKAWTDRKEASKALQTLLRRGFSYSIAMDVLKQAREPFQQD